MLKITTNNLTRSLIAPLVALTLVAVGCTNKDKDKGSVAPAKAKSTLANDALLSKIPTSTAAFMVIDYSGEGYKLFTQSPYGSAKNAKKSVDAMIERVRDTEAGEELSKILQRVLDSGVQLGIVAADGSYTIDKVIARSVAFAGPASNGQLPIDAGIFLKAAPGIAMTDKLEILKKSLADSSLTLAEESIAGATKAFSINLPNISVKAYFAANSESLGATLSKPSIDSLFASANTGALEAIQSTAEYKQANTPLAPPEKQLAFTYVSLTRLRPLLEAAAKSSEPNEIKPSELPFDAVAMQSSFPKQYIHNLGLAVTPKTDLQTKVFSALQGGALAPLTTKLPPDAAMSISVDTHFLGKLEPMIKSIEESAPIGLTEHVKNLEGLTIGLRNNASGSPLPDLFLVMDSAGRDKLGSFLESSLGMAMSMTGQNTTWKNKEIDGVPTKFFTTLIGAGVYISAPNSSKSLLIGSSDNVVKDVIAAQSGKSAGAAAAIPAPLKSQLSSANIASFYFNFNKVADVLDSAKNTLAMFTGGNSELNELLESANIRSWGLSVGGVSYTPGVLAIDSAFEASGN